MAKRGNPNMRKGAPSINPNGRAGVRTDGLINQYTAHGTADDRRTYTRHVTRYIPYERAVDLRRGNWIAKRICEWLPKECFSKGYTLKLEDKEIAEEVNAFAESLCLEEKLIDAGAMERACGGAILFPVLDGAIGDLSEPLDLDAAPRILGVRAIHLLEPRELSAVTYYDDIAHSKFRRPERYRVMTIGGRRPTSTVIHESRLVVFSGDRVSNEDQPGQQDGFGDGKLVGVEEIIHDYGLAWGSAATILHNFSERIQAIEGLEKILAHKDGAAVLAANLKRLDMLRSTLRTRVVSASAALTESAKSVAGLADMLVQMAQLVSGAGDIPMTHLFGMSPAGMNATGEFDLHGIHKRVAAEQKYKYRGPVEWFNRLILLSAEGPTNGQEPDVWSVEWVPLKQQSEAEIATTRNVQSQTDERYCNMGMPAENILRDRFGGDTYSMETTFDEAAFEAQKKADEAAAAEVQAAMRQLDEKQPPPGDEDGTEDDRANGHPAA